MVASQKSCCQFRIHPLECPQVFVGSVYSLNSLGMNLEKIRIFTPLGWVLGLTGILVVVFPLCATMGYRSAPEP